MKKNTKRKNKPKRDKYPTAFAAKDGNNLGISDQWSRSSKITTECNAVATTRTTKNEQMNERRRDEKTKERKKCA